MLYADSSALVKLVRRDPESDPVLSLLGAHDHVCSSIVASVEVVLAARKASGDVGARIGAAVLRQVTLIDLDRAIAARAAEMVGLRSPSAIHLATALSLGGALTGIVTYDRRLADEARATGMSVLAPVT